MRSCTHLPYTPSVLFYTYQTRSADCLIQITLHLQFAFLFCNLQLRQPILQAALRIEETFKTRYTNEFISESAFKYQIRPC